MSRFKLEPSQLIGNMDVTSFNTLIREKKDCLFRHAIPRRSVSQLSNFARLNNLIGKHSIPTEYIDVISDGSPKRLLTLQREQPMKTPLDLVCNELASGASIRVSDLQEFDRRLKRLVLGAQRLLAARVQVNLYATPPRQRGFNAHFDTTDVFIIQCVGEKEWSIYDNYDHRLELPLVDTAWEPMKYKPIGKRRRILLAAGDVLYLPRGTMHAARCKEKESLHLTVSVDPVTLAGFFIEELRRLSLADVTLRRRIDWDVGTTSRRLADLQSHIQSMLERLILDFDMTAFISSLRRDMLEQRPQGAVSMDNAVKLLRRRSKNFKKR